MKTSKSESTMLIFMAVLILGCVLQLNADASELNSDYLSDAYEHCSGLSDKELAQYAFEAGQLVDGGEIDDCAHAVKAEWEADDRYYSSLSDEEFERIQAMNGGAL